MFEVRCTEYRQIQNTPDLHKLFPRFSHLKWHIFEYFLISKLEG
jgi:hypothetical protein